MPALAAAIEALGLDVELARRRDRRDERGRRARLQRPAERVRQRRAARTIDYFVFDLPFHRRPRPAQACRCARAARCCASSSRPTPSDRVRFSQSFDAAPAQMLEAARQMGSRASSSSARDAPYVSGRTETWLKLKCQRAPGVRDLRLHRPRQRRTARSAACCSATTRTASCKLRRQRRHRLEREDRARPARAAGEARGRRAAVRCRAASSPAAGRGAPPAASAGSSPSWSPRSRSPNGRPTATCATRCSRACASTSRRRR